MPAPDGHETRAALGPRGRPAHFAFGLTGAAYVLVVLIAVAGGGWRMAAI